MDAHTDDGLWRRALAGEGEAFGLLFDRHRDRVFRHAYRILQHVPDSEDAAAAVFLELWRRRESVRIVEGSVLPWLLATTTNVCRNLERSRRRYRALLAALPHPAEETAPTPDPVDPRLVAAIGRLRPQDAQLFALIALEDYAVADAARAVGLSPGAARTRLHRIRVRLQSDLGHPTLTASRTEPT